MEFQWCITLYPPYHICVLEKNRPKGFNFLHSWHLLSYLLSFSTMKPVFLLNYHVDLMELRISSGLGRGGGDLLLAFVQTITSVGSHLWAQNLVQSVHSNGADTEMLKIIDSFSALLRKLKSTVAALHLELGI